MFLDTLPKWEQGRHIGKINWEKSTGQVIHFVYDDIKGNFKILEYKIKKKSLIIQYDNKDFEMAINNIRNCSIGAIVDN